MGITWRRTARRYWKEPRGILFLLLGIALILWRAIAPEVQTGSPAPELLREGIHQVRRVVDGDTLLLESGARVRLQGIDCPESVRENWPVEPWAPESSAFTKKFIADANHKVRLTFSLERKDQHDRFLAFVWNGNVLLNEELVRAGLAHARLGYRYSSTMKRRLAAAEREAKAAKRGLWSTPASPTKNPQSPKNKNTSPRN